MSTQNNVVEYVKTQEMVTQTFAYDILLMIKNIHMDVYNILMKIKKTGGIHVKLLTSEWQYCSSFFFFFN